MSDKTALTRHGAHLAAPAAIDPETLHNAILLWANATTDPESKRRRDLLRDKARAVGGFFAWVGKPPQQVTPIDIAAWQAELEGQGLAAATVYAAISRVSSWYDWALADPDLAGKLRTNPVNLARPKAPKPYQSEATKALDDQEVRALLGVIRSRAAGGDLVGKRDLALLLFYLATGMRRREVMGLRWGNVKIDGAGLVLTGKVKGGAIVNRAVDDPRVKAALLDYLRAAGRLETMTPAAPLWVAHDRRATGAALTSHAFVKNLKAYAQEAGIGAIHLHQTRHTFARVVSEETGSETETQEALGHRNLATTRVYVQRVAVKRDKHSTAILDRLGG